MFPGSVAVAVMNRIPGDALGARKLKVAMPAKLVCTVSVPRKMRPDASLALFPKNSIVNFVNGLELRVPVILILFGPAWTCVNTGTA